MTRKEEKTKLRETIRALEKTLSEKYKAASSAAICRHLLALPEYRDAETLFCFVGTASEIDTRPLLESALATGKQLCVPLCVDRGIMELRKIRSLDELTAGRYGLWEPSAGTPTVSPDEVDLAIIPCLTCDHSGRRLGRGGGYYDRFLSVYRAAAVVICRERLIRDEIPVEPHDMPIPWVVTEKGLFEDGIPSQFV